jgi:hypothetical protein
MWVGRAGTRDAFPDVGSGGYKEEAGNIYIEKII